MAFRDIALPIASLGIPVIRLRPRSKAPMDDAWPSIATTDVETIEQWSRETPDANCGSVAKESGVLFFESDEPGVIKKFTEATGESFKTFTAQSRPGRFHFYFKQTDLTRKVGSIGQSILKFGTLRQHNAFVVSPGSVHPTTGEPYIVARNVPLIDAPDSFISWLASFRDGLTKPDVTREKIESGGRNDALTSYAGKLRNSGLSEDEMLTVLLRYNAENCVPPLSDKEVSIIAWSIGKKPAGSAQATVLIGGVPAGMQSSHTGSQVAADLVVEEPEPEIEIEYPYWAWNKTLYEEFANVCGVDNLVPKEYFIESAKTIVGAIAGHRVLPSRMPHQEARFYTILLSAHGGIGKSSAVKWAEEMFLGTGMLYELAQDGPGAFLNIGCAQGGFASGSGLVSNGLSRHERLLQNYDEVTSLIEKFGITGSGDTFLDAINTLFESGFAPGNIIRGTRVKDAPIKPVHNSILGCSTFEKWNAAFVKTNSESSGFFQRLNIISSKCNDRVANFTSPDLSELRSKFAKKIQPLEYQTVEVIPEPDALETLEKWHKERKKDWKDLPSDVTGRIEVMIHRNASHLAWMLDPRDITPNPEAAAIPIRVSLTKDIMDRALALADYQVAVRLSHQPAVGNSEWALVENLIKKVVSQRKRIIRQDLYKEIRADKFGIQTFNKAIDNLALEGFILFTDQVDGKRGRKGQVILWINE